MQRAERWLGRHLVACYLMIGRSVGAVVAEKEGCVFQRVSLAGLVTAGQGSVVARKWPCV